MKVAIALSPYRTAQNQSGLGVFILSLTLALIKLKPNWNFLICVRGEQDVTRFQSYKNVQVQCLPDTFLWKDIAHLRNRDVDVWLYLNPSLPIIFRPKKSIIIALDLSIFYHELKTTLTDYVKNKVLKFMQRMSIRQATHIVSISHATKADVHHFFSWVVREKVSVIMSGFTKVREVFTPAKILDLPENYYLMVGAIKPRKNQLTAVRAFFAAKARGLQGQLLIVGNGKGAYYEAVLEAISKSAYKHDVIIKGYVTNEELVTLYTKARAFVFPSRIEGFGMVVVEAMSCGVPVIASSNSAQGEVANGYALTVDADDELGFTEAMLKLENKTLRDELIAKGYERASHFSWKKTATGYAVVIEQIGQK